jgi:opacity protein-like surface antigen
MRKTFLVAALLVAVLTAAGPVARAQEQARPAPRFQWSSTDLAITYTTEQSKVIPSGASFWLQGASANAAITFFHGFGLAMNLTGDYASRIAPGVSLGKIAYMAGPRYTSILHTGSKHEIRLFGEGLAGAVRGFDSVFPVPSGITDRASAFSMQVGGGLDIAISKHFALRAIEADWVRTLLPNDTTNTQDHLRLAIGIAYHAGKH